MMPRQTSSLPILALLAALVAACGDEGGDPATATGTLEYVQSEVGSMVPARVARVFREEGDTVSLGDTLVTLARATTAAEVAAARSAVDAAVARLRDLEAGPRSSEVASVEAQLVAAAADAARGAREVERLTPLVDEAISRQRFDEVSTAARVAAARRDALAASLRTLRAGARPDQVAAARAQVASARAALDAAMGTAGDLVLLAPAHGVVISRQVEGGEVVAPGVSLITVASTRHPYVRVFVGQDLLPRIRVGASVPAVLDEFPDRTFTGRVAAIATRAEFTPRVALTREERRDLLFAVRLEFDDTTGMLKAGVPITVRFTTAP